MSEIQVIKGNRIIRVTENELEKYLTKGYRVMSVPEKAPIATPEPEKPVEKIESEIDSIPTDTQVKRRRRK